MLFQARELAEQSRQANEGMVGLASRLALHVAERLGGAIDYDAYELYDVSNELSQLMAARRSRVLPIGDLCSGAARHRALLFKALADRIGLPVGFQFGRCLRGAHAHHAWNVFIRGDVVVIVDVLHAPGQLYDEGSREALWYKREEHFAFASLASTHHAFNEPNHMAVTVK